MAGATRIRIGNWHGIAGGDTPYPYVRFAWHSKNMGVIIPFPIGTQLFLGSAFSEEPAKAKSLGVHWAQFHTVGGKSPCLSTLIRLEWTGITTTEPISVDRNAIEPDLGLWT